MKLLSKYNRVNVPITVATLLISAVAYYFILHYVLVHQLDKDLIVEKQEILHFVQKNNALPEISNYKDQQIHFRLSDDVFLRDQFSTGNGVEKISDDDESFRRLEFALSVQGKNYIATVSKSQQETEDIVRLILLITFLVIAFLLVVLFIVNRFLLDKLWQPFNHTLLQLKQFNLSGKHHVELQPTGIDEFEQLNKTALTMTQRMSKDYESLKSFTENASHEIQTPLAIIKSKIELLSQSENLDQAQVNALQSLSDAATRLSKLNQSLLLLTKIENRQFVEAKRVNISSVLLRHLENFEELAGAKNIKIVKNIHDDQYAEMNDSLAEILISNLIINAIKHNHEGGEVFIHLEKNTLIISNTGAEPEKQTSEFFERFKKDSNAHDSLGLGLSIVKKICDSYGFSVRYEYTNSQHVVTVQL